MHVVQEVTENLLKHANLIIVHAKLVPLVSFKETTHRLNVIHARSDITKTMPLILPNLNIALLVFQAHTRPATEVKAVTNVQLAQHQTSLVLPLRVQCARWEENKKEKEIQHAAPVSLEDLKRK